MGMSCPTHHRVVSSLWVETLLHLTCNARGRQHSFEHCNQVGKARRGMSFIAKMGTVCLPMLLGSNRLNNRWPPLLCFYVAPHCKYSELSSSEKEMPLLVFDNGA